jgi:sortase A
MTFRVYVRMLLLIFAVIALSYSGWIYGYAFLHQRAENEAFDRARQSRTLIPQHLPFEARLVIARLNLTAMVEEGVGENTLSSAAGHIPSTAFPGEAGNVGVAAHRDTLFRKLKDIRKNDRIELSTVNGDYAYQVTSTTIVRPTDISVLAPTAGEKTLTLVTCYPFYFIGHAPQRFIVRARQIDDLSGHVTPVKEAALDTDRHAPQPTDYLH